MSNNKTKKNSRSFFFWLPRTLPEIIILIMMTLIGLMVWFQSAQPIIEFLQNPQIMVLLIIMLVEYLVLKYFDRSTVYRRELERRRDIQNEEIIILKEVEEKLERIESELAQAIETEDAEVLKTVRNDLTNALQQMKSR